MQCAPSLPFLSNRPKKVQKGTVPNCTFLLNLYGVYA